MHNHAFECDRPRPGGFTVIFNEDNDLEVDPVIFFQNRCNSRKLFLPGIVRDGFIKQELLVYNDFAPADLIDAERKIVIRY